MEPPCVGSNPTTPATLREKGIMLMLSRNIKIGLLCIGGISAAVAMFIEVGDNIKSVLWGITILTVVLAVIKIGGC